MLTYEDTPLTIKTFNVLYHLFNSGNSKKRKDMGN